MSRSLLPKRRSTVWTATPARPATSSSEIWSWYRSMCNPITASRIRTLVPSAASARAPIRYARLPPEGHCSFFMSVFTDMKMEGPSIAVTEENGPRGTFVC
jgi:hypothetical protein